jgi:hypothetical protein
MLINLPREAGGAYAIDPTMISHVVMAQDGICRIEYKAPSQCCFKVSGMLPEIMDIINAALKPPLMEFTECKGTTAFINPTRVTYVEDLSVASKGKATTISDGKDTWSVLGSVYDIMARIDGVRVFSHEDKGQKSQETPSIRQLEV